MSKSRKSAAQQLQNDEVCYCERCGVSFLWTIEEKSQAKRQADSSADELQTPTHCPGCRLLLPTGARERGLVKWYNGRKRFGFIIRPSGAELFAHGSELKEASALQPGDLVEFGTQMTDKGEAAHEVVVLQSGNSEN